MQLVAAERDLLQKDLDEEAQVRKVWDAACEEVAALQRRSDELARSLKKKGLRQEELAHALASIKGQIVAVRASVLLYECPSMGNLWRCVPLLSYKNACPC